MQRHKRLDISIVQRLDGTFWCWQEINGHPKIWLDYGATSQKLNQVIDAVSQFYQQTNSNLHLGAHELAEEAIDMYEDTRVTNQKYINTARPEEIIFYRAQRRPLI